MPGQTKTLKGLCCAQELSWTQSVGFAFSYWYTTLKLQSDTQTWSIFRGRALVSYLTGRSTRRAQNVRSKFDILGMDLQLY